MSEPRHRVLFIQAGVVPCRVCRKPHDKRWRSVRSQLATWADPVDGHSYEQMGTEEAMAQARADLAARIVAAVEGLPGYRDPRYSGMYEATGIVSRADILDAIKREASDDRRA